VSQKPKHTKKYTLRLKDGRWCVEKDPAPGEPYWENCWDAWAAHLHANNKDWRRLHKLIKKMRKAPR